MYGLLVGEPSIIMESPLVGVFGRVAVCVAGGALMSLVGLIGWVVYRGVWRRGFYGFLGMGLELVVYLLSVCTAGSWRVVWCIWVGSAGVGSGSQCGSDGGFIGVFYLGGCALLGCGVRQGWVRARGLSARLGTHWGVFNGGSCSHQVRGGKLAAGGIN